MPFSEVARAGWEALEPSAQELYEDSPCGYLTLVGDGTIVRANRTLLRSLGHERDELLGRRLQDVLTPGSRIYHATHWAPLLELQGQVADVPAELLRADGSRLPVLLSAVQRRTADGRPAAVSITVFDATDRRRYERELVAARDGERAARRLGTRALTMPVPELLEEATRILGETLRTQEVEISDRAPAPGAPREEDRRRIELPLGPAAAPLGVLRARRATGFSRGDQAFADAVGLIVSGALRREADQQQLHHRVRHDALTSLPNRLNLEEELERRTARARAEGSGFAVCLVDLDDFKVFNDARGHRGGNALLRMVALRLTEHAPDGAMVGRLAGDAFVVVGALGTPRSALVDSIAAALATPLLIEGLAHPVSASVGSALGGDRPPEELLLDADIAMYAAKDAGRGRHAEYRPELRERSAERMRTERELRTALAEGQLRVFYQPIADTDDRAVSSFEALVRWEHPERGLVAPGAFIPIAEESGLIAELGDFVLGEACLQLARWRAAGIVGPEVGVTVNVAARQLDEPAFPARVAAALAAAGLETQPALLGLEVTETDFMRSRDVAAQVLADLGELGVRLLLDDFGTGLSSLARLRRLPVDTLKIDRSFVKGLGGDGTDDAIAAAILAMAGSLGLRTVAEGVETEAQLAALAALGCDTVQGFLFSRPVPAAEVPALLAA